MAARFPDLWVPPAARSQAGLFRVDQAIAAGMTPAQVRRRRDTGRWVTVVGDALAHTTQPGARTRAPSNVEPWLLAHGAWLTWPDSVVCFGTAAQIHGLPVADDGRVHVLVPHPRAARTAADRDAPAPGQHSHAARMALTPHEYAIGEQDVMQYGRARATTLSRTIFDCIGRFEPRQSEQLMSWVLTRELMSREELERALDDAPRRWGNTRRRQALVDTRTGALGAAERRLHAILARAGFRGWSADQRILDEGGRIIGRADVLFSAERLILEVDGLAYHGADRFQADRTRQNRLVNAGYTVLRFTWQDLMDRPNEVIDQVRAALSRLASQLSRGE